jgi:hypothetical protein
MHETVTDKKNRNNSCRAFCLSGISKKKNPSMSYLFVSVIDSKTEFVMPKTQDDYGD